MESQIVVRDYAPEDFERVKAIHETSGIDYQFPDLGSPLFLVTRVLLVDGEIRACGGLYLQCESYLWLDRSDWAGPGTKLAAIKKLDEECMYAAWLKGIDQCVLWLPPGMERFGKRLVEDLGFAKDRDGWMTYSKGTNQHENHN